MVVVGVSRRSRLREALTEGHGTEIARLAGAIDVHLVTHEQARSGRRRAARSSPLSRGRRIAGWVAALVGTPALTLLLLGLQDVLELPSDLLLFLAFTVLVALVGGLWPALVSAVLGFLLLNWFFTEPTGRLSVAQPENALALAVFVLVAAGVASVVDLAARRTAEAYRARAEASALAAVSRSVLSGEGTAEALVARLRETFTLDGVALLERDGPGWVTLARDGAAADAPAGASTVVDVDETRLLALSGRALPAGDRRVLEAFGSQVGVLLEQARLRERADHARVLEQTEGTRTALLAAVSHDLRTPLATIRAAVDALTTDELRLSEEDRDTLVATLAGATGRLEHLIDDLLDLSRLQTGSLRPRLRPVSLEEVVPAAAEGHPEVRLELPETLPLVLTDPGLLERVVANLVDNAARHAPAGTAVTVSAQTGPAGGAAGPSMVLQVVDRGPGVPDDLKGRLFEPFQRLGDTAGTGLGLGLAVARGLADAVGAEVRPEDTPGGGLTMVVVVPLADARATSEAAS